MIGSKDKDKDSNKKNEQSVDSMGEEITNSLIETTGPSRLSNKLKLNLVIPKENWQCIEPIEKKYARKLGKMRRTNKRSYKVLPAGPWIDLIRDEIRLKTPQLVPINANHF